MHKLLSALRKEFLILIRDIPGLAILFIMPVLLILVVTVAQNNALKSSKESKTDILFIDLAHSSFSRLLQQNLDSSGLYRLITQRNSLRLDDKIAEQMIGDGDFPIGIFIGPKDTAIRLVIDPSLQSAYRNTLVGSLTYFIRGTQSRIAIENLLQSMAPGMGAGMTSLIDDNIRKMPPVTEIYPTQTDVSVKPSLIQNDIPGFILFAMFFIVIPLSGSMITEKNEGSFSRLRTLPVRIFHLLSSKVILFLFVCMIQFLLMLMVGTWILPSFFGIPALQTGPHILAILMATTAAALAAIGFGLMVGTFATTPGQAALFGSVMVVILGVISGTFLPVYLMPKAIRIISSVSPIRWGIENYIDIFVRNATLVRILPNIFLLLAFFIFAMIVSIANFARRK